MNTSLPTFSSMAPSLARFIAPLLAAVALAPLLMPSPSLAATRGSGNVASESRSVGEFQAVSLSGSMDVVVTQGATALKVQADDNLLPMLETVVESGRNGATLHVRWKRGESIYPKGKVLVTVSTPKLVSLANAGSGDLRIDGFNTPELKISLSGSGNAQLNNLATEDLGVSISGSSDVAGTGKATKLRVSIAGSGDVKLDGLQADDVSVRIAGSGDAHVNAQKSLDVSVAGSGDVTYTGNAAVKSSVAGSGSVRRK